VAMAVSDSASFVEVPIRKAMTECGIQIVQDETFYVEPKKEETA